MAGPRLITSIVTRYIPKAGFKKLAHAAFSALMQTIIDASSALDSAVPAGAQPWSPTPDTAALQAYKDSFDTALAAWNPTGPRGSRTESDALKNARKLAEQGFQAYMDYVASWAEYNNEFILAAGLQVKSLRTPPGTVGTPTDIRQVYMQRTKEGMVIINGGDVALHFKKAPNQKTVNIYSCTLDNERRISGKSLILSTTKSRFNRLSLGLAAGAQVIIALEAVGSQGTGGLSNPVTLTAI